MFQDNLLHYFSCGASALNVINAAVALAELTSVQSVLDFGSGAGRVTRWLRAAYPQAALTVADLRGQDLAFCATEFGAQTWVAGTVVADLVAPGTYDLIWVGSVLTHLSEGQSMALTRKLLSFLDPNGLLVMSVHGRFAHGNATRAGMYGVDAAWPAIEQAYAATGYGYADYPGQDGYGISLTKPSWTARFVEAMPDVRLVLLSERAWDGHHDIVALQNTPAAKNVAW